MRIVKPNIEFLWCTPEPLRTIEAASRTCYKSEDKITPGSAEAFVKRILARGHEAMVEHASMSYRITCDRGVANGIVRHRLFSFAQESTQYCDYAKDDIEFIEPNFVGELNEPALSTVRRQWEEMCKASEFMYKALRKRYGCKPETARGVLPHCLKTELVVTGNMREWRHYFALRCSPLDQAWNRQIAVMLLRDARGRVPVLFEGIDHD